MNPARPTADAIHTTTRAIRIPASDTRAISAPRCGLAGLPARVIGDAA